MDTLKMYLGDLEMAGALSLALRVLGAGLALYAARTIYRGIRVRLRIRSLAKQGIPIMPHSLLLGHLPVIARFRREFPADLHISVLQLELNKNYKKYFPDATAAPSLVYLDLWPFSDPICVCVDPEVSSQITQTHSLPKGQIIRYFVRPLTQEKDMVCLEGDEWKIWRSRFNPGFSARNITALVPTILEEIDVFVDQLTQLAGPDGTWGEVFQLEKKAMDLTFDVIGRAALDVKFNEQSRSAPSAFKNAFFGQLDLMKIGASLSSIASRYTLAHHRQAMRNTKVMDDYLIPYVHQRDAITRNQFVGKDTTEPVEKIIIDLALAPMQKTGESAQLLEQPNGPLMHALLAQLKIFLFAGHDTTASTMSWTFHLLSKSPRALARLRAEHDGVFGATAADIKTTRAQIAKSPQLLNQLPYTVAVIKETLRLQPPAGSFREGQAGYFLSVPGSDIQYPTEGFSVLDSVKSVQARPGAWDRPDEFLPERFITASQPNSDQGDTKVQPPPPNAWRAFGQGPRNCIGQELAMVELKLVLVLLARQFDIECAWDKWDALTGQNNAHMTYDGDRLYPYGESAAHCKDHMPAHVRLRTVV